MIILQDTGGIVATNCYLVADEQSGQAVLFDAPDHTIGPLLDEAQRRGWDIVGLWLTHGHFDHLADHAELKARFPNAKILIHPLDEAKLRQPNSAIFMLPFHIPPGVPDALLADGQTLRLGSLEATVIHTPGHSPGHVMFHFPREKMLIGGDLIIMGAVGRTDLPDSNHAALNVSIRKVMQLPSETRLLPGHGQASTLRHERETNPHVGEALEEEG
jgi:glyoxylase-like metal-dependent hydrolase (beta-lactamase superfamily II)